MAFIKQYDKDDLIRLKQTEVQILEDIIAVCKKHGINYFVVYGTLIGVVRHKGFIPWDDDLDIGMCREDYEKFKAVFEQELGDKYIFATPLTLKGYCSSVTKVMKKGTRFVPGFSTSMKCRLGIHIDLFVFDKTDAEAKSLKWDVFRARFYAQLLFLAGSPNPIIDSKTLIGKAEVLLCKLIHYMICWIPGIAAFLYKRLDAIGIKSNQKNGQQLICFFDSVPFKNLTDIKNIFPTKTAEFEGKAVQIPANTDEVLKKIYGNYMELPPEEERVNHCAEILEFEADRIEQ